MRINLPNLPNKELHSYLKSNKDELIHQKCLKSIKSEDTPELSYGLVEIKAKSKSDIGTHVVKMSGQDDELKDGELKVKVLANTFGWCDSHNDVLIPNCCNKTIKDKGASNKSLIYHLADHNSVTTSIIGGQVKMEVQDFNLSNFNINSDIKKTEVLIGNSIVKKKYDSKVYELYLDDEIKQHSIGLRYVKLFLCIDSKEEEYAMEKDNWNKYYKYVINKDKVNDKGFFWAVTEIKLLEYSAVLWGSNELTTTQEIDQVKNIEPLNNDTQNQEPEAANQKSTSLNEFLTHLTT